MLPLPATEQEHPEPMHAVTPLAHLAPVEEAVPAPLFSVVIPACDEECFLPKNLAAIAAAQVSLGEAVEVIVVDNGSHDRTVAIAEDAGAIVVHEPRKCLSAVRNAGARAARGQYLVFVDADSCMSENMLVELRRAMASGRYIGGGMLNVKFDRNSLGIFCSTLAAFPIVMWLRTGMCLFFTHRDDFEAIGGWNEELYALEDVDFAQRLLKHGRTRGKRFKNVWRAQLTTSARKFDEFGDWFIFRKPLTVFRAFRNDRQVAHDIWYRKRR